ncbi:MAG TPA: hypothetical protein VFA66_02150 [Gaiellaceae bacterium]|nr:hypothetical protein [Gaiellaceae bacterium]
MRNLGDLVRRGRAGAAPKEHLKLSAATEAFFRTDGPHDDPVVVVYHIQKTAGTALRHVVRANLPPAEVEILSDLRSLRHAPGELLAWYGDWYRSLAGDRRERLCCVMSHLAGYVLPALDRPAEALVLVREPVDRTISYYHVKRRRRDPEKPFRSLEEIYDGDPAERGLRRESWEQFFNWQSRCLLSVFHDVSSLPASAGPSPDAELWRERLRDLVDRVFTVGVQDRFSEYLDSLSERFGWEIFVRRSKVNPNRPPVSEIAPELRETIRAYNWLDAELYELARDAQERNRVREGVRAG